MVAVRHFPGLNSDRTILRDGTSSLCSSVRSNGVDLEALLVTVSAACEVHVDESAHAQACCERIPCTSRAMELRCKDSTTLRAYSPPSEVNLAAYRRAILDTRR